MDRRQFIQVTLTSTGGLLIVPFARIAAGAEAPAAKAPPPNPLGVYLRIDPDNRVFIGARSPEIGQGVKTSLPMILADELDVAWSQVTVEQLPLGMVMNGGTPAWKYGPQGAGGSTSIPSAWADLRQVGAQGRWLMRAAAARRWNASVETLRTEAGHVVDEASGQRASYGELASLAVGIELPGEPLPLKRPDEYRIIGRPTRVVDAHSIVDGTAVYGIDVREPGACVAVIARCPWFDGELERFDDAAARRVPGVRTVIAVPGPKPGEPLTANLAAGVAVIAEDTWAALKGREALDITWRQGPHAAESSAALDAQCAKLLEGQGQVVRNDGDFEAARSAARRVIEARYRVPYVAHCPLEPQNAFVHVLPDRVRVIAPVQQPAGAQRIVHLVTGVPRDRIEVQMTRVGGGFGRRLSSDYVAEAALVSKATGLPIRLVWTREDDLQHDWFRPFGHHHLIAAVDPSGNVTGWAHRLASASKYYRRPNVKPEDMWTAELYPDDLPARLVPNLRLEWFPVSSGVIRGSWRAPAHTANAFVVQSFLDEIAAAMRRDPLELRLALLRQDQVLPYAQHGGPTFSTARLRGVLQRAAERIGWGRRLPRGRGLGIAAHFTFGGYAAHAMEVEVTRKRELRIRRVVCAVDVGRPVNPLGIEAQMQGGTIDGLSTALGLEITVENGRIVERNFDRYPLLRMADAPDVEVVITPSELDPSGAGEMGTPTAAPALTNAIFAASGIRIRNLPLRDQLRA